MSIPRPGKSRLFLLELIFMIFLFAVASSVCIQIFVKAYTLSRDSGQLTAAVNLTQSTASILETGDFLPDDLINQWPDGKVQEEAFLLYLNEEWQNCAADEGVYLLNVEFTYADISEAYISISDVSEGDTIYSLKIKHYEEAVYEK